MVPVTTSQNKGLGLSNATMVELITMAADMTHSEDQLSVKAG